MAVMKIESVLSTIAFGLVDGVIIYIGTDQAPSDADWSEYIAFVEQSILGQSTARALVVVSGGGPSGVQRQKLHGATRHVSLSVAVVTQSAIARGLVTALSWVKSGYRAFTTEDLEGALDFLGVKDKAGARARVWLLKSRIGARLERQ